MTYALPTGKGTPLEMGRVIFYPLNTNNVIDVPGYPTPAAEPYEGIELIHPKTFQPNLGTPRTIPVPAQGQVQTTFVLPSLDAKTGELHLAYLDLEAMAALSNVKTHVIGGALGSGMGTNKEGFEIPGILMVQQLKWHQEADNLDAWHTTFYLRTTCKYQPNTVNENPADYTVTCALNSSKKHVTGQSFTQSTHGFTKATSMPFVSWGQLNLVSWLADGVEDTFLLPDEANSLDTFADTFKVYDMTAGEAVAGTAAVDQFVADAAPIAGHTLLGWYEQISSVG